MNKTITFWYFDAIAAKKDGRKLEIADLLILLRSGLIHQEIRFNDRDGISFSSTMAEKANGCRFKLIAYSHPHWWKSITLKVSEEQEEAMWCKACKLADLPIDWMKDCEEYNVYEKETEDGYIYQGPKHVKYDLVGLLSFALEKAPQWYVNAIRFVVWSWTVFVKPDPKNMWCSESCLNVWNAGLYYMIEPTEIDPEESFVKASKLPDNIKG